jgi:hypothetical protein
MTQAFPSRLRFGARSLLAAAVSLAAAAQASLAQEPPPPPDTAASPAAAALTTPAMSGPLTANPNPIGADLGPAGRVYFGGAISGMALFQDKALPGNNAAELDLSNGLLWLQKSEGLVQFFAMGGVYSFPTLGTPYFHVPKITGDTFGPFPVAYGKLAPTDEFSFMAGKLPTLIGAEYAFTFQNMNIERGLLWNQEPIVSRGVQGNYSKGPLTLSVSLNDGFYSGSYNWMSGLASYALNKENTLAVAGGGNFGRTTKSTFATPLPQNNSRIVNLIYTYNSEPWTITPYFQYTGVPENATLGIENARTYGGAVLANYKINDQVNIAGRAEYVASTGTGNLLYGPGSSAASLTVTPTWQNGVVFLRGEGSVVHAFDTPGAFGRDGTAKTQVRWVVETGIVF